MKILCLLLAVLVSTSFAKNLALSKTDKEGVSSNYPGGSSSDAVAFGVANYDQYVLTGHAKFINPKLMDKIPRSLHNPGPAVMGEANTFNSGGKFYYDGTSNLSAIHVNCNVFSTMPSACVKNASCGWCGQHNNCVEGNSAGPLGNCLRSTFLYSAPVGDFNHLKAGTINILGLNKSGGNSFILTPEPNLSKISVK